MLSSNCRLLRDLEGPLSSRFRTGSVAQDNRSKVWNFFWWENGKRKCKALGRFPTKAAAWKAAKPLRDALEAKPQPTHGVPTVSTLIEQYKAEKCRGGRTPAALMHRGFGSTSYPKWGQSLITELQARPVELWLNPFRLRRKAGLTFAGFSARFGIRNVEASHTDAG